MIPFAAMKDYLDYNWSYPGNCPLNHSAHLSFLPDLCCSRYVTLWRRAFQWWCNFLGHVKQYEGVWYDITLAPRHRCLRWCQSRQQVCLAVSCLCFALNLRHVYWFLFCSHPYRHQVGYDFNECGFGKDGQLSGMSENLYRQDILRRATSCKFKIWTVRNKTTVK